MGVFDWSRDREELLELRDRVARLEEQVAALTAPAQEPAPSPEAAGPSIPAPAPAPTPAVPDPLDEARNLAARGNKVRAIKVVCDVTGMGLKQAKDLVDGW